MGKEEAGKPGSVLGGEGAWDAGGPWRPGTSWSAASEGRPGLEARGGREGGRGWCGEGCGGTGSGSVYTDGRACLRAGREGSSRETEVVAGRTCNWDPKGLTQAWDAAPRRASGRPSEEGRLRHWTTRTHLPGRPASRAGWCLVWGVTLPLATLSLLLTALRL